MTPESSFSNCTEVRFEWTLVFYEINAKLFRDEEARTMSMI